MDKEMLEQFQLLFSAIEEVKTEVQESEAHMNLKIQESETRMKVFVKNEVTKRIDTLFDGYKLTHEKQWELERETENLKRQVDDYNLVLLLLKRNCLLNSIRFPSPWEADCCFFSLPPF